MLNITIDAAQKRKSFRQALASGKLLQFPGAFSPLVARQIEQQQFDGVYISGAVLAADLGFPDISLTTLSEVTQRGYQINNATNLPTLIDVDTGFGEPMNMARTIFELEQLGLSGCHLEDQLNPKRCGHLDNKQLISTTAMAHKIRAATDIRRDNNFLIMARTDAKASEGIEAAIARAQAYVDAGADAIFPEALYNEMEFEAFRRAIKVPLLANMTEFGKSRLLSRKQLENLGINIVIYPVSTLRCAMAASEHLLKTIHAEGSQQNAVAGMQSRDDLYDLLQYQAFNRFDQSLFNFRVATAAEPEENADK